MSRRHGRPATRWSTGCSRRPRHAYQPSATPPGRGARRPARRRTRRARRAAMPTVPMTRSPRPTRRSAWSWRIETTRPMSHDSGTTGSARPTASPSNSQPSRRRPRQRCTTMETSASQNAHTSPWRGLWAASTSTLSPDTIDVPMEVPDTSSHNVFDDAARRNTDAVGSGLAVDIADVSFRLVASDPRRVTVVEDLLGGLARTTRPAEATVHLTQRRPAVPDRPPDETTNAIHVWYTDDRIAVDCATGLSAVADGAHAEIGGATPSSELQWSLRSV